MLPLTLGGIAGVQGPPWMWNPAMAQAPVRSVRGPALRTADMTLSKSTIESIEDIAFNLQLIQKELRRMNGDQGISTEALVDRASNQVDIKTIFELIKDQRQTIRSLSQRVTLLETIVSQTTSAPSDLSENCAN